MGEGFLHGLTALKRLEGEGFELVIVDICKEGMDLIDMRFLDIHASHLNLLPENFSWWEKCEKIKENFRGELIKW